MLLGSAAEVLVGGLLIHVGRVWFLLADPDACTDQHTSQTYGTLLLVLFAFRPVLSLLSGLVRCPRCLYKFFSLWQLTSIAIVFVAASGKQHPFWSSPSGSAVFVVAYSSALVLESYLVPLSYRYIGDEPGLTLRQRQSASNLLAMLGMLVRSSTLLAFGFAPSYLNAGCDTP